MIHKEIDFNIGITNSSVLMPLSPYRNNGTLNNVDRRETDRSREDTRAKPEAQKAEAERESVMEKIREHEERIRSNVPDQVRFRKDELCPDRELC